MSNPGQQAPQSFKDHGEKEPQQGLESEHKGKLQYEEGQKMQEVDMEQVVIKQTEPEEEKLIEDNPQKAEQHKQKANEFYKQKQYSDAIPQYQKALSFTAEEPEQRKKFKAVLYSNMGLTLMKMEEDESAIKYLQSALKLNPEYGKARTNLALTYEKLDKLEEALDEYKKLYEATPEDKFIKGKVTALEIKVKELQEKRKEQVISGLKNIGNSVLGYFGMSLDNFKLNQGPGGGYNVEYKP